MNNETFSITFGDRAENHVGMEIIGKSASRGFTINDLETIKHKFGNHCELINLPLVNNTTDLIAPPAAVLIIRNGVNALGISPDNLFTEMRNLPHDKKAKMRGRVVNKRARWNLCFSQTASAPNIENGRGTVIAFKTVPLLNTLRDKLINTCDVNINYNMQAELNYYYDVNKCGIGFHGDTERKIVICARLGATIPLHYQWYYRFKPVGDRIKLQLNHGDIYIMSSKAVGTDWKRSSILTLRHAAGAKKYIK